jgi:multidrug efflux pump subunit AcrB
MLFYLVDWNKLLTFVRSNLKQYIMRTISLITLLLAKILFIMSAYVNEPILTAISVFGIIVAISIFIDDAISVKKSKKHY